MPLQHLELPRKYQNAEHKRNNTIEPILPFCFRSKSFWRLESRSEKKDTVRTRRAQAPDFNEIALDS
jgi:hypothetical protein